MLHKLRLANFPSFCPRHLAREMTLHPDSTRESSTTGTLKMTSSLNPPIISVVFIWDYKYFVGKLSSTEKRGGGARPANFHSICLPHTCTEWIENSEGEKHHIVASECVNIRREIPINHNGFFARGGAG